MNQRPRRLRKNALVRDMVQEIRLSADMFVYPYFVTYGTGVKKPIPSMPGINHFSVDTLLADVAESVALGLTRILLFGVGEEKTADAKSAYADGNIVATAVKALKDKFGDDLYVITDVCVCAYTDHGHCGVVHNDYVQNDESVEILSKMALSHTQAGADMVAPSDMMDGRIGHMRDTLDAEGYETTAIMSYSIKYASAYYGPFRDAADSTPGKGDRKSYQMDFRNRSEAMREAFLDESEGADVLMVKPALAYLDVISDLRRQTTLPVACYNVSGEFSMVKAASQNGWIDEKALVMENMYAFARAGANIIITYHAKEILKNNWL
ncbi:MAG: porphobilinogen synthase [Sphingobacteriales bacterium]|jgi:porphobilinogen synthase